MIQTNFGPPNPADNYINLDFPDAITETRLALFSSSGNLLFETTLTKNKNRIPVAYLSAGLYVIKLQSASQIQTLKVLKK
ncbi:T9SS type A sorting domain-containing protein [uncultured Planktosalinus sp.]|uniref:T9SS type A sorting domain-containing protein n=1 Tax=uncultured Planktosalinus sp. TaxID=1810935 RepID=UPI0030D94E42